MIALLNQWFRIARQIAPTFFTAHMANIIAVMMVIAGDVMLMSHGGIMIM